MPEDVAALYIQVREAHTRDGWHIGGPLVAQTHHKTLTERQSACDQRPPALRWMLPLCDSMRNEFAAVYGGWPTAFLIFHRQPVGEHAWTLVYRSQPLEAYIDVTEVLDHLWARA